MKKFIFLGLFLNIFILHSQESLWTPIETATNVNSNNYTLQTSSHLYFNFDFDAFRNIIKTDQNPIISLPLDNNELMDFQLQINTTMAPKLMFKYPGIRAFDGISINHTNYKAKIDIGPNYFRAMILRPGKSTIFIDPVAFTHKKQNEYVVYTQDEFQTNKEFICNFDQKSTNTVDFFQPKAIQTCELRTYRVAVAATGEYTAFQGGTIAQALAAQVTTLNRVNGIYERDLAITLTLIGNNDTLIYTDANTDPYSNGNPGAMISENTTVLNQVIGVGNFDIGHVFGTNSGGLAYLNCVCNDQLKAKGVTGSSAPVGDPFDVDYVAHEMGHQFGASHTFNNACNGNRNNFTAVETGSGSTIMGYAGVCNPNVQFHSDPYFQVTSLKEIGTAISSSNHTCPVITPLSNTAPVLNTPSNLTIPSGTPFILTAVASDQEGDSITYCWEQIDNDISAQPPVATAIYGPNFRSFSPTPSSKRYIPSIGAQLTRNFTWERLSTVARNYKFGITARDNSAGVGGCTDYKEMTISVDGNSGPFAVTYPNTSGIIWTGLTTQTVQWDIANTDIAPISCLNVKISISTDGGDSFTTLVANTPNDGKEDVVVPNINTTDALIMITSENGIFFDISDKRFTINFGYLQTNDINNSSFSLKLSPNPTNGNIKVNFENKDFLPGYRIINSLGQIVIESKQKISNGSFLNLQHLKQGIYFFESTVDGRKIIQKIILN